MRLSPHFTLSEFTKSQTAERKGIDNTPEPIHIKCMETLCINVLEPININGGVSNVCVKNSLSEIVIFRREEWFKVLIHETFHNYGLDFSDLIINSLRFKCVMVP